MLANAVCVDFFYPVGFFPKMFHMFNLPAPPGTEKPQREKGQNPAREGKEGFTKVKGEPKGNKTVNGHETIAQGAEDLARAGGWWCGVETHRPFLNQAFNGFSVGMSFPLRTPSW